MLFEIFVFSVGNLFVISSFTHWLFRNLWFNFHIFLNSPNFILLQVLISFHWGSTYFVFVFKSLLRLILCLSTWSILENVPCPFENNVDVLQMINRANGFVELFSLLSPRWSAYLVVLLLKVWYWCLWLLFLNCLFFLLFIILIVSWWIDPDYNKISLFVSRNNLFLTVFLLV